MYSAIFVGKFSLSSTSATKVYLNLEIPEVAEIIDRNGKKHDPIQEIPKIHAKQFSEEAFSSNNMKTIPELKCIQWDPTKQIPMQNLSHNKPTSTIFIRSSQESSSAISSIINTNDATKGTNDGTKGENDKSLEIEQIRMDQTSNVEDEEIDDDNIPLNMLYKPGNAIPSPLKNVEKEFLK
nr:uncharacterized protein LOC112025810 [Quercus suber]